MVRKLALAAAAAFLLCAPVKAQTIYYLALGVGTNDCADFLVEVDRLAAGEPARRHEAYAAWIAGYVAGALRDRPGRISLSGGLGQEAIMSRVVGACRTTPAMRFSDGVEAALKDWLFAR